MSLTEHLVPQSPDRPKCSRQSIAVSALDFCQWESRDTYPVAINVCKPKTINSHGSVGGSTVVPEVNSTVVVHEDVVGFSVTKAFAVSLSTQHSW